MFKLMKNFYELQELQRELLRNQIYEIETVARMSTEARNSKIEMKKRNDEHWENQKRTVMINERIMQINEHLETVLTKLEALLDKQQEE